MVTASSAWLVDLLPSLILCTDTIAHLETERKPRPDEDRAAAPQSQDAKRYHGTSSPTHTAPNTYHISDLFNFHQSSPTNSSLLQGILFKPPLFGAYSELFAALSPKITAKHNGGFVIPWGRFGDIPDHIEKGLKPRVEGGSGAADKFWNWCERETGPYL